MIVTFYLAEWFLMGLSKKRVCDACDACLSRRQELDHGEQGAA